jgi:hypothetical protein
MKRISILRVEGLVNFAITPASLAYVGENMFGDYRFCNRADSFRTKEEDKHENYRDLQALLCCFIRSLNHSSPI